MDGLSRPKKIYQTNVAFRHLAPINPAFSPPQPPRNPLPGTIER